jgi:hypothetical protein
VPTPHHTMNPCVSLLGCPLTAVLCMKQHGLLFSPSMLDGITSPWLFVFPSRVATYALSLHTQEHKSLFLLGNIYGVGKVVFVARRQIAGRWASIYWSPSFNVVRHCLALAVSARVSTHTVVSLCYETAQYQIDPCFLWNQRAKCPNVQEQTSLKVSLQKSHHSQDNK